MSEHGMDVEPRGITLAVVGATGQVGEVMRDLLAERNFPVDTIRFFASARSAGTTLPWRGGEVVVERSEEHTSELQSRGHLVCRLLLEKKNWSRWGYISTRNDSGLGSNS